MVGWVQLQQLKQYFLFDYRFSVVRLDFVVNPLVEGVVEVRVSLKLIGCFQDEVIGLQDGHAEIDSHAC